MSSLPSAANCHEQALSSVVSQGSANPLGSNLNEQHLLQAFRSFSRVAGSLEQSYLALQTEVGRLRQALAEKDNELACQLKEKQSERDRLNRILRGLPCGVLVVFGNGRIWKANPEALRLLEIDSVDNVDCLSKLSQPVRELFESVREDESERELEISNLTTAQWLAARHAQIEAGIGVFILRDVTEHKRLEETQARLRREQALAEITAILAHEIRNPLGSLELFSGLLSESPLTDECRTWVGHIQAGLRTLSATVNNVLQFHNARELEFAPVDIGKLLDWAVNFCGPVARQTGITLSLQNAVSGLFLAGDRHRLEQLLLNLVLNALRATPAGGWVEISGRRNQGNKTVELSVADTGSGIPDESLAKIFDPGFSTRRDSPGLGLAVCRRIVQQHGGAMHATNRGGGGAKFTAVFPLQASGEVRA
jgi:signal transduction histidine kinase